MTSQKHTIAERTPPNPPTSFIPEPTYTITPPLPASNLHVSVLPPRCFPLSLLYVSTRPSPLRRHSLKPKSLSVPDTLMMTSIGEGPSPSRLPASPTHPSYDPCPYRGFTVSGILSSVLLRCIGLCHGVLVEMAFLQP